jgi:hypothetical protein
MKIVHNLSRTIRVIVVLGLGLFQASFTVKNTHAFTFESPTDATEFSDVVLAVADIMMKIGIPAAAIFLIYTGFLFVSARGDETKLKTAKEMFKYTVIGTAIITGAYFIASAVVNFARNLS